MKKLAKILPLAFFVLCFLAALILAGDNSQSIPLRFLDIELVTLPFALWLVLCFTLGALLVLIMLLPSIALSKAKIRKLQRKLKGLSADE
jgi:uncharacterized integral membrane protein